MPPGKQGSGGMMCEIEELGRLPGVKWDPEAKIPSRKQE